MKALRTPVCAVLTVLLVIVGVARGQSPLGWKLQPGQSLLVEMRQQTTSQVGFSGKTAETKMDLTMELVWTFGEAGEQGTSVTQRVERIVFQLTSAKAGEIKYDSADPKRPATKEAREVAEAVKPLLGAEITIVMTERGEIKDAQPANDAAKALFAAAGAADPAGVFSAKAIETLLRQPLAVLPEKAVADGETWTVANDLDAAAGKFKQTTTYRLAGTEEHDGQKLARVEHSAKLAPAPAPLKPAAGVPQLALKSHEQTGHYLFSPELGRLVSATQTQKLTTERPYRETTIVVTLDSTQTTTIKPAKK